MSYVWISSRIQATSSTVSVRLAPGMTTMRFWAVCSVTSSVTWPTPEEIPGRTSTWLTSTPAFRGVSSSFSPKRSPPTQPIMVTSAPRRAHCRAWLAPLPPGAMWKDFPYTVWAELGTRSVVAITSITKLPTTRIRGFLGMIWQLLFASKRLSNALIIKLHKKNTSLFWQVKR